METAREHGRYGRASDAHARLFCFKVLQRDPAPCAQAVSCLFDAPQETRVVFQPVFEPVIVDSNPISTPAGFPWRVMMISCGSASRRNRDRSSLISDREKVGKAIVAKAGLRHRLAPARRM